MTGDGMTDKVVRLGAGMAFWGDRVQPAAEMVERADIDYLCCDHLAELTMKCRCGARIGERPTAASIAPTGPSSGIG